MRSTSDIIVDDPFLAVEIVAHGDLLFLDGIAHIYPGYKPWAYILRIKAYHESYGLLKYKVYFLTKAKI